MRTYTALSGARFSGDPRLSNPWQPAKYDQHFLIMVLQHNDLRCGLSIGTPASAGASYPYCQHLFN